MDTTAPPKRTTEPAAAVEEEAPSRWKRWANGLGGERFWPASNDFPLEIEKCTRILQTFTSHGIQVHPDLDESPRTSKKLRPPKVVKKIPAQVIQDAKGICIYSSMKSAIPPFGSMSGTGLLLGRLPDGSWSPPSAISPNYYSAGLVVGLDLMDIILIINTDEMLASFKSHKFALTAETHITSGPVGAAYSGVLDLKKKPAPLYSYVNSRGFYAGIELTGQVFFDRFDENERFYYWPGIKQGDILEGKVEAPPSVEPLHRALREAETGVAQGGVLETVMSSADLPKGPDTSAVAGEASELLKDGERLQLPPTPEQLQALEMAGFKDEMEEAQEKKEREAVRMMPPPPTHPDNQRSTTTLTDAPPPTPNKPGSDPQSQTSDGAKPAEEFVTESLN